MIVFESENVILDSRTSQYKSLPLPGRGLAGKWSLAAGKVNFKPRQTEHHCVENYPPLMGKAPLNTLKF